MTNIREIHHLRIKEAYEAARHSDVVLVDSPNASLLAGPVTRLLAANRIDVPVSGVEFAGQAWLDFLKYKGFLQNKIKEIFSNPILSDNLRQEYRAWLVVKTKNIESGSNTLGGRLLRAGEIIRAIPHNRTPKIVGLTALPLKGQNIAVDDFLQVATEGRTVEFQPQPLLSGGLEVDGIKAATIFDYAAIGPDKKAEQRRFLRGLLAST